MNKIIILVVVIVIIGFIWINNGDQPTNVAPDITTEQITDETKPNEVVEVSDENIAIVDIDAPVKEFAMDSFVEFVDEQPKPQFSVKEITVNKGDLVKLNVTVTKGTHDFKIDEFDVFVDTPTGETTTVEFVADKAGEFVYYCNQPGHRANGHWGTLKVLDTVTEEGEK